MRFSVLRSGTAAPAARSAWRQHNLPVLRPRSLAAALSRGGPQHCPSSPRPNQPVPDLYLNVSDVSAASGLNPYRSGDELMLQRFKKEWPQKFAAAHQRFLQLGHGEQLDAMAEHASAVTMTVTTSSQLLQLAAEDDAAARTAAMDRAKAALVKGFRHAQCRHTIREVEQATAAAAAAAAADGGGVLLSPEVLERVSAAAAVPGATAADISAAAPEAPAAAVAAAAQCVAPKAAVDACETRIQEYFVSQVHQERGRRGEAAALEASAGKAEQPVVESNTQMYYAYIWLVEATGPGQPGMLLKLGGKVDGWLEDRSAFVEVKTHQYSLRRAVPDYERVQVVAYMECTRVYKCLFTETYLNSFWAVELVWDKTNADLWQEAALPGLLGYAQRWQELLCSEAAQDELLLSCRKQGYFRIK